MVPEFLCHLSGLLLRPLPAPQSADFPLFASDATLSAMPATVLLTCEFDQLRPQSEDWAHRLVQNGVPTLVKCVPGTAHGFSLSDEGSDPVKVKEGIDFLVEGPRNYLVK